MLRIAASSPPRSLPLCFCIPFQMFKARISSTFGLRPMKQKLADVTRNILMGRFNMLSKQHDANRFAAFLENHTIVDIEERLLSVSMKVTLKYASYTGDQTITITSK